MCENGFTSGKGGSSRKVTCKCYRGHSSDELYLVSHVTVYNSGGPYFVGQAASDCKLLRALVATTHSCEIKTKMDICHESYKDQIWPSPPYSH